MYEAPYVDAIARIQQDLGLDLSSMPSNAGTPVGTVSDGDESSVAIAEMLHEIVSECRGALEYAAPEAPVYRLATHVMSTAERVV